MLAMKEKMKKAEDAKALLGNLFKNIGNSNNGAKNSNNNRGNFEIDD